MQLLGFGIRLGPELALESFHTRPILAQRVGAPPDSCEQLHQLTVRRLAARIHRKPAFQRLDGLLVSALGSQGIREAVDDLACDSAQPGAGEIQPFVEDRLARVEVLQKVPAIELDTLEQLIRFFGFGEAFKVDDVGPATSLIDFQQLVPRDDQIATGLADRGQRLAKVVPGTFVTSLTPQHPGQPLPCMRATVFDGQIGQQRPSLLVSQSRRFAIGPARVERA